jgi:hypothetical protein
MEYSVDGAHRAIVAKVLAFPGRRYERSQAALKICGHGQNITRTLKIEES